MSLHGKPIVAGAIFQSSGSTFKAFSPINTHPLEPLFENASAACIHTALTSASEAFRSYRKISNEQRASFLDAIAEEILSLGDTLLERANLETGLPLDRLTGERGRTVGQLRLFASVIREGSWADARIDSPLPARQPLPRPDLRSILVPIGPVVVFGASNFPLAFSVAGGDTASALAAGCPVIVKGHPAHPGTCELVATAITKAAQQLGIHPGVFSMVHGNTPEVGMALVSHPLCRAVGFTGSLKAGRALFDAAHQRPEPIPVFAEMSSLNPIFLLPDALRTKAAQIAEGLKNSITIGVGQFCTKPGIVFAQDGPDLQTFLTHLSHSIGSTVPGTMLHSGIRDAFEAASKQLSKIPRVQLLARAPHSPDTSKTQAIPLVLVTDSQTFERESALHEEVFGPITLIVKSASHEELLQLANGLSGQLTATVHANEPDMEHARDLFSVLEQKAGRLLLNGFPTGVEVSHAMHHGGPYPSTTHSRFTSVGAAAIQRWVRPVCFQNFTPDFLPAELRDANPTGLMRIFDGQLTRNAI